MNRPLSMDDAYPKICRSDGQPVHLKLGPYQSRPMNEDEILRLRNALNADAAERARPQSRLDVDARAFAIEKIRSMPDAFDDAHFPEDFEDMTPEQTDATWADVHDIVSTCLIALGEETVARVTTDELRCVALDLTHARDADEKSPPELLAVLTRASNELAEMSERAEPDPPAWTAEPPECDCWWWKPDTRVVVLVWCGSGEWIETSGFEWTEPTLLRDSGDACRFLAIPGGIPVCPEVTP